MFILFAERKVGEQHGPAAQGVLAAVQTLREMNADNLRKVPADAPTAFIKPRWKPLVITPEGLDRKFYEICALSELKNALRSGDIWVKGSRQFRDFDDYLLPAEKFAALKREQALPLAINPNSDQYLEERLQLLDEQLATVTRLAKDNELPDAILTESGLKITPLDAAVPDRASIKTVRCKKRHVNVGRIRHLLSDAMLAHLIRPTNRIESVGQIRHFRSIRHLLSDAMLAHLIRPTNRIEP